MVQWVTKILLLGMYNFSDKFIRKISKFYIWSPNERQKSLNDALAECKSKNSKLIGFYELIKNEKLRKRCWD